MSEETFKRFRLEISPDPETGEVPDEAALYAAMAEAGWSDDPGTGRTILLANGAEVINPIPMAPPVGYKEEQSMLDRLSEMLSRRRQMAEEDELSETEEESQDFDVADEFDPVSLYEVVFEMADDPPHLRKAPAEAVPMVDPAPGEKKEGA